MEVAVGESVMKQVRVIAGCVIGLLVVVSCIVSFLQPSSVDVARSHCSEKGLQVEKLILLDDRSSGDFFGNSGTVEFQVKGANPPKKVVVELLRPVYFLPWQVEKIREGVQQMEKLREGVQQ